MVGPTRFSPTPCSLQDLPEIDAVLISHDQYDHLDSDTIKEIHAKSKGHMILLRVGREDVPFRFGRRVKARRSYGVGLVGWSTTIGGRCWQRQSCVHACAESQWKSSVEFPSNIVVLLGHRGDTKRRRRVTACGCIIFVF